MVVRKVTISWRIEHFDSIDSTNRYLLDSARDGGPEGLVATTDHQTAGRGRRGRVWDDKPGTSLLVSMLFRPDGTIPEHLYAQAVALGVTQACRVVGGFEARLKWPNDVLVQDRKLAGILAEASSSGGALDALVVGCGVNLNWGVNPSSIFSETAVSADEPAGHYIDRGQFLDAMLEEVQGRLGAGPGAGESIRQAYAERCATLGRRVHITQESRVVAGRAESIHVSGALVVRTDNGLTQEFSIGDVVHLRPEVES